MQAEAAEPRFGDPRDLARERPYTCFPGRHDARPTPEGAVQVSCPIQHGSELVNRSAGALVDDGRRREILEKQEEVAAVRLDRGEATQRNGAAKRRRQLSVEQRLPLVSACDRDHPEAAGTWTSSPRH